MVTVLDRLPPGSRICVIRLRSLGDCILTTPALALLKTHRPDLKIHVVVEPRFVEIFEGNPDVDEISERPRAAELTINLHGGTRSMWMTLISFAKHRAGFGHHRYSFIYSDKIPTAQEILGVSRRVHTAEHLAAAMFYLGVPQTEIPRARLFADPAPARAPYVVMHPFASAPDKAWPTECFVAAAEHLRDSGIAPLIVAGPEDDVSRFSSFEVLQNAPLCQVKSLFSGAAVFLGNDSGPAHMAAAFGVPVVVLFGPSDPLTWAPWQTESRVLTSSGSIADISMETVLSAVEQLKPALRAKA